MMPSFLAFGRRIYTTERHEDAMSAWNTESMSVG